MKHSLFILFLFLFHLSALGFDDDGRPDCTNPITTNEVEICIAIETEIADENLSKYLQAARQRFAEDSDWLSLLDDSQVKWTAYRQTYCDSIYQFWIEGSIRGAKYSQCMKALSKLRTHVIWKDYLTYADSTPPILPEPK